MFPSDFPSDFPSSDFFLKFSREPVLYCVYIYIKKKLKHREQINRINGINEIKKKLSSSSNVLCYSPVLFRRKDRLTN